MNVSRHYSQIIERIRRVGLRPTRQRLALAKLLFDSGDRHVTAEILHGETLRHGISVSLATVYNTLNQFTNAGLLHEIVVDGDRSYFDTNTSQHHHFYHTDSGRLEDIAGDDVVMERLPAAPNGMEIERVDVIVRVSPV